MECYFFSKSLFLSIRTKIEYRLCNQISLQDISVMINMLSFYWTSTNFISPATLTLNLRIINDFALEFQGFLLFLKAIRIVPFKLIINLSLPDDMHKCRGLL